MITVDPAVAHVHGGQSGFNWDHFITYDYQKKDDVYERRMTVYDGKTIGLMKDIAITDIDWSDDSVFVFGEKSVTKRGVTTVFKIRGCFAKDGDSYKTQFTIFVDDAQVAQSVWRTATTAEFSAPE